MEVKPDNFTEELLRLAKHILEPETPPQGNNGCKECQAVQELAEMTGATPEA